MSKAASRPAWLAGKLDRLLLFKGEIHTLSPRCRLLQIQCSHRRGPSSISFVGGLDTSADLLSDFGRTIFRVSGKHPLVLSDGMDNSNLREDQEKTIQEALMKAAAAHRFAELG